MCSSVKDCRLVKSPGVCITMSSPPPPPPQCVEWPAKYPTDIHVSWTSSKNPNTEQRHSDGSVWLLSAHALLYLGYLRHSVAQWRTWVVRSILHGVDPLSYFSYQPVLQDWCNKGRGMYYPVCGMMHIKEPLLLIGKSSLCGGSGFPLLLSE